MPTTFFFQAEDGIRDGHVTGVQTCALPISNARLGYPSDLRDYGLGAQILFDLGVRQFRFLTNNPKKVVGLEGYGLEMVEQVPIRSEANPHNAKYLETKKTKLGHLL